MRLEFIDSVLLESYLNFFLINVVLQSAIQVYVIC